MEKKVSGSMNDSKKVEDDNEKALI